MIYPSWDELHELVKSLTRAEHLRFLELCRLRKVNDEPINRLDLYEFLKGVNQFSYKSFTQKFGKHTTIGKYPAVHKAELYMAVLNAAKSLDGDDESEVTVLILQAKLLIDKGLIHQVGRILEKAELFAEGIEDFENQLKIYKLFREVSLFEYNTGIKEEILNDIAKKEVIAENKISNLLQFQRLLDHCYSVQRSSHLKKNLLIDEIKNNSLISDNFSCQSLRAQIIKSRILIKIASIENNLNAGIKIRKETIKILESKKKLLSDNSFFRFYLLLIRSEAIRRIAGGDLAAAKYAIDKFAQSSKFKKETEVAIFEESSVIRLAHSVKFLQNKYGDESIEFFLNGKAKFGGRIRESIILENYYSIICFYHFSGRLKEALNYVNLIRSEKVPSQRAYFHFHAWFVFLFLHYELGNFDSLPNFTRQVQAYFSKHDMKTEFEKVLFHFFKKSCEAPNGKIRIELVAKLIPEIEKKVPTEILKQKLRYFPLYEWADSIKRGKNIRDCRVE